MADDALEKFDKLSSTITKGMADNIAKSIAKGGDDGGKEAAKRVTAQFGAIDKVLSGIGKKYVFQGAIDSILEAEKVASSMGSTLDGSLSDAIGDVKSTLNDIGVDAIQPLVPAISDLADKFSSFVKEHAAPFKEFMSWLGGVAKDNSTVLFGLAAAVLGVMAAFKVVQAAKAIVDVVTAATWAWNIAMSANPIVFLVLAIVALVAGLIWFFTQSELGKEVWANISAFFVDTWTNLVSIFTTVWEGVVEVFTAVWDAVVAAVTNAIAWVNDVITNGIALISLAWTTAWQAIGDFFTGMWEFIVLAVTTYLDIVWTVIQTVIDVIVTVWNTAWQGILDFFTMIWEFIVLAVTTYINVVSTIISTIVGFIVSVWNGAWAGISSFFGGIWNGIIAAVSSFGSFFQSAFSGIAGFVQSAFAGVLGAVKGPINAIISLINGAIGALNSLSVTIPDWVPGIGGQKFGLSLPRIPQLAAGGIVASRPGGIIANIGEGRYDEAVVPLTPAFIDSLSGGSGRQIHLTQQITTVQDDPRVQARQWGREMLRGLNAV